LSPEFTAIVMAGGRGTRMGGPEEKPLVRVAGVGMLERVVAAIRESTRVSRILVACSPHTPKTEKRVRAMRLRTVQTSGRGYVEDAREASAQARTASVVVISADLPLISGRLIDAAAERYLRAGKPALTTVAKPVDGGDPAPVGLNVFDRDALLSGKQLREETFVVDSASLLVNVNTREEVERAERIVSRERAKRRGRLLSPPG